MSTVCVFRKGEVERAGIREKKYKKHKMYDPIEFVGPRLALPAGKNCDTAILGFVVPDQSVRMRVFLGI